jgi:hypothetical protein
MCGKQKIAVRNYLLYIINLMFLMCIVNWYLVNQKVHLTSRQGHVCIFYKSFLYIIGGYTGEDFTSETHCAFVSYHPCTFELSVHCIFKVYLSIYLIASFLCIVMISN